MANETLNGVIDELEACACEQVAEIGMGWVDIQQKRGSTSSFPSQSHRRGILHDPAGQVCRKTVVCQLEENRAGVLVEVLMDSFGEPCKGSPPEDVS